MISELLCVLISVGGIVLIVWYLRSFYAARAARQKQAGENLQRHGGERVLEWDGGCAEGAADAEFGKLVVEIPKKSGDGAARFYEKGLALEHKRLSYSDIKDVLYAASSGERNYTLKQAARDMAVLWIYPKKGATIGIREMNYRFDNETMEKIKKGLGF